MICKNFIHKIFIVFVSVFLASILFSCSGNKIIATVSKDTLFTLNYGTFENELNLFNLALPGNVNTHLAMKDGFFYIANGEAKKIMELNSYGDLLTLYYNEEFNRKPSFILSDSNSAVEETSSQTNATCKAITYPFNTLGPIAVDSKKNIYVADTLPKNKHESDNAHELLLSNVVLRFSSEGKFVDYLGQEGPGGSPFSYIKKIYTTKKDELVVVCATNEGMTVYWFNESGFLLYMIPVTKSTVPIPFKKSDTLEMYVSVENAVPDSKEHMLYLQVNYFESTLDPALKVQSGVDFKHSLLYPLDVDTGVYYAPMEIAPYEDVETNGLSKQTFLMPYDFSGITDSGWFFFSMPTENGYSIQVINENGRVLKRNLDIDKEKMLYYSVTLSSTGIISGIFAGKDNCEISWWRMDQLIN